MFICNVFSYLMMGAQNCASCDLFGEEKIRCMKKTVL